MNKPYQVIMFQIYDLKFYQYIGVLFSRQKIIAKSVPSLVSYDATDRQAQIGVKCITSHPFFCIWAKNEVTIGQLIYKNIENLF